MIDQVFRDEWGRVEWGRVLASLIGYFGDFDLAEDAAAEAFAIAAPRWPSDGVPGSPAAWLVTTARHRAIVDQLDLPGYQYWHSTRAELLRPARPPGPGPDRITARAGPGPHRRRAPVPAATPGHGPTAVLAGDMPK